MTTCQRHPDARTGHRGRCLDCHREHSQAHRQRRVEANLPEQHPMSAEQRERKQAADRARYAANAEKMKAAQRDRYHAQLLQQELALVPSEATRPGAGQP